MRSYARVPSARHCGRRRLPRRIAVPVREPNPCPEPKKAANAAAGIDQPGGWVLDDGFKVGVGCQNTLADVIDRRGQQGDAVGVATVQVTSAPIWASTAAT